MYGSGKSDRLIVPKKPSNKAAGAPPAAERVEGRGLAKGNPHQPLQTRTQSRKALMLKLERIRQVARQRKMERFTWKGELGVGCGHSWHDAISHEWMLILQHRLAEPRVFHPYLDQGLRVIT